MKKRILAWLLLVCMVLGMLPATVSAATYEVPDVFDGEYRLADAPVTISTTGKYKLYGSGSNPVTITKGSGKVTLVLDSVSIESATSPLYLEEGVDVTLILPDGSRNVLKCTTTEAEQVADNAASGKTAGIRVTNGSKLTIATPTGGQGDGMLTVTGGFGGAGIGGSYLADYDPDEGKRAAYGKDGETGKNSMDLATETMTGPAGGAGGKGGEGGHAGQAGESAGTITIESGVITAKGGDGGAGIGGGRGGSGEPGKSGERGAFGENLKILENKASQTVRSNPNNSSDYATKEIQISQVNGPGGTGGSGGGGAGGNGGNGGAGGAVTINGGYVTATGSDGAAGIGGGLGGKGGNAGAAVLGIETKPSQTVTSENATLPYGVQQISFISYMNEEQASAWSEASQLQIRSGDGAYGFGGSGGAGGSLTINGGKVTAVGAKGAGGGNLGQNGTSQNRSVMYKIEGFASSYTSSTSTQPYSSVSEVNRSSRYSSNYSSSMNNYGISVDQVQWSEDKMPPAYGSGGSYSWWAIIPGYDTASSYGSGSIYEKKYYSITKLMTENSSRETPDGYTPIGAACFFTVNRTYFKGNSGSSEVAYRSSSYTDSGVKLSFLGLPGKGGAGGVNTVGSQPKNGADTNLKIKTTVNNVDFKNESGAPSAGRPTDKSDSPLYRYVITVTDYSTGQKVQNASVAIPINGGSGTAGYVYKTVTDDTGEAILWLPAGTSQTLRGNQVFHEDYGGLAQNYTLSVSAADADSSSSSTTNKQTVKIGGMLTIKSSQTRKVYFSNDENPVTLTVSSGSLTGNASGQYYWFREPILSDETKESSYNSSTFMTRYYELARTNNNDTFTGNVVTGVNKWTLDINENGHYWFYVNHSGAKVIDIRVTNIYRKFPIQVREYNAGETPAEGTGYSTLMTYNTLDQREPYAKDYGFAWNLGGYAKYTALTGNIQPEKVNECLLPRTVASYDSVPLGANNERAKLERALIVGNLPNQQTEITRYDGANGAKRYRPAQLLLNPDFLSDSYEKCDRIAGKLAHDKFSVMYGISATGDSVTSVEVKGVNQDNRAVIYTDTKLYYSDSTDVTITPWERDGYEVTGVEINGAKKDDYDPTQNNGSIVHQDVHGKIDQTNKLTTVTFLYKKLISGEKKEATIVYNSNLEGIKAVTSKLVGIGSNVLTGTVTKPSSFVHPEDWTLMGWSNEANAAPTATRVWYTEGQDVNVKAGDTLPLYAIWQKTEGNDISLPGKDAKSQEAADNPKITGTASSPATVETDKGYVKANTGAKIDLPKNGKGPFDVETGPVYVYPDGTVVVPKGRKVTDKDGNPITGPATIDPEGGVKKDEDPYQEANGDIRVPGKDGKTNTPDDAIVKGDGNGNPKGTIQPDGTVKVNEETTVEIPGKGNDVTDPESKVAVTAPAGSTVAKDGTITVPDTEGTTATVARPGGETKTAPAGSEIAPDGSISYKYTIKYVAVKGDTETPIDGKDNDTVMVKEDVSKKEIAPPISGYVAVDADKTWTGGDKFNDAGEKDENGSYVIKFKYKSVTDAANEKLATIIFHSNKNPDKTYTQNTAPNAQGKVTLEGNLFSVADWTFGGWSEKPDCTDTTLIADGAEIAHVAGKSKDLYAHWYLKDGKTITVAGKDAKPENADTNVKAEPGDGTLDRDADSGNITIPNNGSVSTANGTILLPYGGTLKPNGTLIPKDEDGRDIPSVDPTDPNTPPEGYCYVIYNGNGAKEENVRVLVKHNTQHTVQANKFTLDGHVFSRWTDDQVVAQAKIDSFYKAGDKLAIGTEPTKEIFAQWFLLDANENITVPGKDGDLTTAVDNVQVKADPSNPTVKPSVDKDGNVVVPNGGQVKTPDNGTIVPPNGSKVKPDGTIIGPDNKTIDPANPDEKYVTITYKPGDGKGDPFKQIALKPATVQKNQFEAPVGKEFENWKVENGTKFHKPEDQLNKNTDLVAQWKQPGELKYKATVVYNSNLTGVDPVTKTPGSNDSKSITYTLENPFDGQQPADWTLMGWSSVANGAPGAGRLWYKDAQELQLTSGNTYELHAIWHKDDTAGSSVTMPGKDAAAGAGNDDPIVTGNHAVKKDADQGYVTANKDATITLPLAGNKSPYTVSKGTADVYPDGTVVIPEGSEVTDSTGKKITGPATIDPEGNVKQDDKPYVDSNGDIIVPGEDGKTNTLDDVVVKGDGKDNPNGTIQDDGKVAVTKPNTTVEIPGKKPGQPDSKKNVTVPEGTVVDPNGTITIPDDKTGSLDNKEIPGGAQVAPDGTVSYKYTVKYLKNSDNSQLKEPKTVMVKEGVSHTEYGLPVEGYLVAPLEKTWQGGEKITNDAPYEITFKYKTSAETEKEKQVTIKFYPNDGRAEDYYDTQVAEPVDGEVTLKPNPFTVADWTFGGWSTEKDGTRTEQNKDTYKLYQDRAEVKIAEVKIATDKTLKLYAQWYKTENGKITVPGADANPNGTTDNVTAKPGTTGALTRDKDNGNVTIPSGGSVEAGSNTIDLPHGGTLKPNGELEIKDANNGTKVIDPSNPTDWDGHYLVTYDSNNTSNAKHFVYEINGQPHKVLANMFTPDAGKIFGNWRNVTNGTREVVPVDSAINAKTTLKAEWYEVTEKGEIIMPGNDGETGGVKDKDNITITPDPKMDPNKPLTPDEKGTITLPTEPGDKGGKVERPTGTGDEKETVIVPPGTKIDPDGTITLPDADAKPLKPGEELPEGMIKITYKSNDPAMEVVEYGTATNGVSVRDGKVFDNVTKKLLGWLDGNTAVAIGDTLTTTTTLTAVWDGEGEITIDQTQNPQVELDNDTKEYKLVWRGKWANEKTYDLKVLVGGREPAVGEVKWEIVANSYGDYGFTGSLTAGEILTIDAATGHIEVKASGIVRVKCTAGAHEFFVTVIVPGDVDRNGDVGFSDATAVVDAVMGESDMPKFNVADKKTWYWTDMANLNKNEGLDISDSTAISDLASFETEI